MKHCICSSIELNYGGADTVFHSYGLLTIVEFALNPEKFLIASLQICLLSTTHSNLKQQLLHHSLALWKFLQTNYEGEAQQSFCTQRICRYPKAHDRGVYQWEKWHTRFQNP